MKKWIELGVDGLVTLDMDVLTEYNFDGTCQKIWCCNETREKYGDRMTTWAHNNGLKVDSGSGSLRICLILLD